MKYILAILLVATSVSVLAQNDIPCLYADIILLSDFSGSMNSEEPFIAHVAETLIEGIPPEQNKIRFGMISFADSHLVDVYLTHAYDSLWKITNWYYTRKALGFETLIEPALALAKVLFEQPVSYARYKILIIVSDGIWHDEVIALARARELSEVYGIALIALSPALQEASLQVDVLTPRLPRKVKHEVLSKVSGGAYFFNNVEALKEEIRKKGLCL
ncbi:MAG: VWA domain-containing protein [Candidatus Pacebacteria bacterium]|nr:VWA domain-containing protein [Candidatus Paceibacterota bacterium]